jgi:ABC-type sugar transport system ATPase subunit
MAVKSAVQNGIRTSRWRSTASRDLSTICAVPDIRIQELTKSFPVMNGKVSLLTALNRTSLDVGEGELLTIVGPSGAGKTTLLRLIAGLDQPDSGSVFIAGQDQKAVPPGERGLAMMFQSLALYPHLTARENVGFGLMLRGAGASEIRSRVEEVARRVGIADCLDRRPADLSGGQRQRVALGRALIRKPGILLLDEPFANLDAPLRRELRRELQRLHQSLALTMILVTHDQAEAMALGQRIAVMNGGRFEQVATPAELRSRPANDFVRGFLDTGAV